MNFEFESQRTREKDLQAYKEAFDYYDWNKSGIISVKDLQYVMRRAGHNPTDVEVHDLINKIDNGSGTLDFDGFLMLMGDKNRETDIEIHYKDTFRAFSKDDDGCIPADELKFVMNHLPGKVASGEIEDMIETVDRNKDGKISYSEFRVMMGGFPLIIPTEPVVKPKLEEKTA